MGGIVSYNHKQEGIPIATPAPALPRQESDELPTRMDDLLLIDVPPSYEKRLEYLQRVVDNDPRLVAQIIKRWVR
jgi:flagellar M-ring protein FliF